MPAWRISTGAIGVALACALLAACQGRPEDGFGGVGRMDHALRGDIYFIDQGAPRLPDFGRLRPVGAVYVRSLQIDDQDWQAGFPGVTDRHEWFAIDYRGHLLARQAGRYAFRLTSDDGSRLLIDGNTVIDNDGVHASRSVDGVATLTQGLHAIEVQYFQGPRPRVSLRLDCAQGGATLKPFPGCGLSLKTPGLSLVWMWWVAGVAAVGAAALWLTVRRLAGEARPGRR